MIAARRAVIFSSKISLQQCKFEGDSEIGIKALQTGDIFSSSFGHLVRDTVENAIKEECSDDQTATEKECTSDENDKDCKKKGKLNDRAYKVKGKDESKRQHLNNQHVST